MILQSSVSINFHEGFHSHGSTPIAGWLIVESPNKMDDEQGYPNFRKPPYPPTSSVISFRSKVRMVQLFQAQLGTLAPRHADFAGASEVFV